MNAIEGTDVPVLFELFATTYSTFRRLVSRKVLIVNHIQYNTILDQRGGVKKSVSFLTLIIRVSTDKLNVI